MTKIFNFKLLFLLVFLALIAGWFYRHEWRPSKTYTFCHQEAVNRAKEALGYKAERYMLSASDWGRAVNYPYRDDLFLNEDYTWFYKNCMRLKGFLN